MSTCIINFLPDHYQDVYIYHHISTRPLPECVNRSQNPPPDPYTKSSTRALPECLHISSIIYQISTKMSAYIINYPPAPYQNINMYHHQYSTRSRAYVHNKNHTFWNLLTHIHHEPKDRSTYTRLHNVADNSPELASVFCTCGEMASLIYYIQDQHFLHSMKVTYNKFTAL